MTGSIRESPIRPSTLRATREHSCIGSIDTFALVLEDCEGPDGDLDEDTEVLQLEGRLLVGADVLDCTSTTVLFCKL
jgi:hypothetical protein